MNSKRLQYPGRDSGDYPPRNEEIGYYDVEDAWERRYRQRQAGLAWRNRWADFGSWLSELEHKLLHLPAAHAHPKLAAVHRPHHR